MKPFFILLTICLILQQGCEKTMPSESTRKEAIQSVENAVKNASDIVSKYKVGDRQLGEIADNELEKLLSVEYQVFDLAIDESADNLAKTLSAAGKERWDCFYAVQITEKLRFFCKRQSSSHLHYLVRSLGGVGS